MTCPQHAVSVSHEVMLSKLRALPPQVHLAWIKTPRNKGGLGNIKIPIIADTTKVGAHCPS